MQPTPEPRYSADEQRRRWTCIVETILNDGANDQPDDPQHKEKAVSGN